MDNESDNAATVLQKVERNAIVLVKRGAIESEIKATGQIPKGHKISLSEIGKNEAVLKYGEIIGVATQQIGIGEHIGSHNLKSARSKTG